MNAKLSELTVRDFMKLIDPSYRHTVRGIAAIAAEVGQSPSTICRRMKDGTLDGCYTQTLTGRILTFNVGQCRDRLLKSFEV